MDGATPRYPSQKTTATRGRLCVCVCVTASPSEVDFLARAKIRTLLDLEQDGVLQHPETMAAIEQDDKIAGTQFAAGLQLAEIIEKIHRATSLLHEQHLARPGAFAGQRDM